VDQSWCTLCYARVDDDFDPLTAPIEQLMEQGNAQHSTDPRQAVDGQETPSPRVEVPPRVDAAGSTTSTQEPDSQEVEAPPEVSDVDVMLSMLAAEHRQGDPTARWAGSLDDKATRITVMAGGALLIAGVGFLVLTILGAIL
jgi:hypothetical protein